MSIDIVSRTLSVHQEHEVLQALENAGLVSKGAQAIIDDRQLAEQIVQLAQGYIDVPEGHVSVALAADIMGTNFHNPSAVKQHLSVGGRFGRQAVYQSVPFDAETLRACRNTHVLQAVAAKSLMEVHRTKSGLFYAKNNPWFGADREAFAHDKPKPGWYLVRKTEVPGSTSTSGYEQLKKISVKEFVPSVAVLAQVMLVHYKETDERLFSRVWVRTSDVSAFGDRVRVRFVPDGFDVDYWGDGAGGNVGVASAWKSN